MHVGHLCITATFVGPKSDHIHHFTQSATLSLIIISHIINYLWNASVAAPVTCHPLTIATPSYT